LAPLRAKEYTGRSKGGLDLVRSTYFDSPFLLGFEPLERTAKSAADSYPPYNIEENNEGGLVITLAVAGFGKDEIAVTLEDRQLIIKGRQNEAGGKTFLHRGIAARQFSRAFVLADGIEVRSAALENGLLRISLARPDTRPSVRVIEIKTGGIS
jgi:HSP20 family molecular chaperone IbpA